MEIMDARISLRSILELPRELFVLILEDLPFLYIFQLRLVCRKWNDMLHDTHFLEENCQLTKRAPLCVCHSKEGFAAYIPETNSWHILPPSFIFMEPSWPSTACNSYNVYGRADGLLLVQFGGSSYLVNPMTRSHRELLIESTYERDVTYGREGLVESTCGEKSFGTVLGMVFDESCKSFKIFGVQLREIWAYDPYRHPDMEEYSIDFKQFLYMYDPEINSIKAIREISSVKTIRRCEKREGLDHLTFHRGVLHYLNTTFNGYRIPIYTVFRLDGDGSGQSWRELSWHQLTATQIPQGLRFVRMLEWRARGKLMLVGGKWKGGEWKSNGIRDDRLSNVQVWELDEDENVWMEKTKMPDDLRLRFSPKKDWDGAMELEYFCDCSGDYVYLTSYCRYKMFAQHIVCNLADNSWWEAPMLPSVSKSESTEEDWEDWGGWDDCDDWDGYSAQFGVFGCFLWKPSFEKIC